MNSFWFRCVRWISMISREFKRTPMYFKYLNEFNNTSWIPMNTNWFWWFAMFGMDYNSFICILMNSCVLHLIRMHIYEFQWSLADSNEFQCISNWSQWISVDASGFFWTPRHSDGFQCFKMNYIWFQYILLNLHDFLLYAQMNSNVFQIFLSGFHLMQLGCGGFRLSFVAYKEFRWVTMDSNAFEWILMNFIRHQYMVMNYHDFLWTQMNSDLFQIDFSWLLLVPVDPRQFKLILPSSNEFKCITTDSDAFWWIQMNCIEFKCIQMEYDDFWLFGMNFSIFQMCLNGFHRIRIGLIISKCILMFKWVPMCYNWFKFILMYTNVLLYSNAFSWIPMISMDFDACQWISMNNNWFQWNAMYSNVL